MSLREEGAVYGEFVELEVGILSHEVECVFWGREGVVELSVFSSEVRAPGVGEREVRVLLCRSGRLALAVARGGGGVGSGGEQGGAQEEAGEAATHQAGVLDSPLARLEGDRGDHRPDPSCANVSGFLASFIPTSE